jgi:hypothetical protein
MGSFPNQPINKPVFKKAFSQLHKKPLANLNEKPFSPL